MCLIVFALCAHPDYPLVAAANRDEFHRRPTASAELWPEARHVLAGRDLEGGGTWLGVTTGGRLAAITNFREPGRHRKGAPSRGILVADFLRDDAPPASYLEQVATRGQDYNGFSLVVGDASGVHFYSNRGGEPRRLGPGVYGLSNHLLDTPWPKVTQTKHRLWQLLDGGEPDAEALFAILADRAPAADAELPSTGVPQVWERALSAPCVVTPEYGTRSSTALVIERGGLVTFVERGLTPDGNEAETREFWLELEGPRWQPCRPPRAE